MVTRQQRHKNVCDQMRNKIMLRLQQKTKQNYAKITAKIYE